MQTIRVTIPTAEISDWASFHSVFQAALGFPKFYGRNMNAWIDCLTYADDEDPDVNVSVGEGGLLVLQIDDVADFKRRCPEQYLAVIECASFVNHRRIDLGKPPVLALLFSGWFSDPHFK